MPLFYKLSGSYINSFTIILQKVDEEINSEDKKSLNPFDTDGERSPSPPPAEKKLPVVAAEAEKVVEVVKTVEETAIKSDSSSHKSVPTLPTTNEPAKEEKETAESIEKVRLQQGSKFSLKTSKIGFVSSLKRSRRNTKFSTE